MIWVNRFSGANSFPIIKFRLYGYPAERQSNGFEALWGFLVTMHFVATGCKCCSMSLNLPEGLLWKYIYSLIAYVNTTKMPEQIWPAVCQNLCNSQNRSQRLNGNWLTTVVGIWQTPPLPHPQKEQTAGPWAQSSACSAPVSEPSVKWPVWPGRSSNHRWAAAWNPSRDSVPWILSTVGEAWMMSRKMFLKDFTWQSILDSMM